jgi:NAD+ diphosphatase
MSQARANFLADGPLDRLGHLRKDAAWLEAALAQGRFLVLWRRRILVSAGEPVRPLLLDRARISHLARVRDGVLLGFRDAAPCFAVGLNGELPPELPGRFEDLRGVGDRLEPADAALLAYGRAMIVWHERHQYCSVCGAPTASAEAGHVRLCAACEARHFPRVDPAIIVLVADDTHCLLGRQNSWPPGRYSTIAGFVEPGESLEDAVRREVCEETGIQVGRVSYHSSQPWPFPSSLMLGFSARPLGGEIALRDGELEDARWISRDDITARHILLPPKVSIAYRLIETWFDGEPGRHLADEAEPGPWIARPEH